MKGRLIVCRWCGQSKADHHAFEAAMPPGCACDPGEWSIGVVTDICEGHLGHHDICERCQHEAKCHRLAPTGIPCSP